ncbi:MAG: class I SAM-dependent methyltransferase [Anaerolineaceae bacterium]
MTLNTEQWHARFVEQSNWTAPLRAFLFSQAHINTARRILEVGCGTGAITRGLQQSTSAQIIGLDILWDRVAFAHKNDSESEYSQANAISLPFASSVFDITYCHYLFLWLKDQAESALREMVRVTRPGGMVLALAEPNHAARIDSPQEFCKLGELQSKALIQQGAAIDMGIHLPELFLKAGLQHIQFGQSGFQIPVGQVPGWFESEWEIVDNDLHGKLTPLEFARLKELDKQSWLNGSRVLQIPTFYAFGVVP